MAVHRSKVLVAVAASTLVLLAGCGASPSPQAAGAPSTASPAAPLTTPATSTQPTPSAAPTDERKAVKDASEKYIDTALTLEYDGTAEEYASRVKPLTTAHGYEQISTLLPKGAKEAQSRFGKNARSKPLILSGTKVTELSADKASATVNFTPRVQQLKDGKWKTIKAAVVDETAKLTLVKDGDSWLVDRFA